jgi:hypothetical protein
MEGMVSTVEQIADFIETVNSHIFCTDDLVDLNRGGCGWYAYYTQREILKRWPEVTVEYVYLNEDGWDCGHDFEDNILSNVSLSGWQDAYRCSASHVVSRLRTPEGDTLAWDSDVVCEDELELLEVSENCWEGLMVDDIFEMKPSVYRKGALEGRASCHWNFWYRPRRGNKALRECIKAY